jgi:Flp pilus assembly protein CpaB
MELEFTDRSRRRRLLMVIGLIMAILAGSTAFFLGNQKSTSAEPVATRSVLVASDTIPARTVIQSSMLTTKTVPDDASYALAVSDPSQVLGLVTAVTVYADQPITPNLLATTATGQAFSITGPTETISPYSPVWRAVSLMVPTDRAVGGTLQPGHHIDIIATVPVSVQVEDQNGQFVEGTTLDGFTSAESTKVTLTDVEVLQRTPETDIYVLKVDLHQAEQLAVLQGSASSFSLALRPEGDNRVIDRAGYGQTINRVLEQYLFPLERILQIDRYPKPDAEIVPEGSPTALWPDPDPASVASPAPSLVPAESPAPSPAPSADAG